MFKKIIIPTILIIISIVLIFTTSYAQHPGNIDTGEQTDTITFNDYNAVGTSWETTISEEFAEISIVNIAFDLTWTDDEGTNSDPDTFSLQATDGMNDPQSNSGSGGSVSISWAEGRLNNVWNIVVACDAAGSTQVPVGPLGIITQEESDPGNSWTLVVTYTYTEGGGGPGGPPANVVAVLNSPIFGIHIALMISSTYLFLFTGIFAGVYLFARHKWAGSNEYFKKLVSKQNLIIILLILAFIAFFIASVPIGMWVAGMFYGWSKAWTGFPALWNPEAFEFTNADNVSFIVLLLWAIPIYLNRAPIMNGKWYKKLFGWSKFLMARAAKASPPRLTNKEFALCYFFMGIFVFLVFMVQPHGS